MPIDYKEYPKDWKQIRERILIRAGHKCEQCGVPNYALIYRPKEDKSKWILAPEGHEADAMALDGIKFVKIVLTIAHVNHDKENHEVKDEELKAWCQRCHLMHDLEHHKANRKYGRDHKKNNHKLF